jgi:hypothetical protein
LRGEVSTIPIGTVGGASLLLFVESLSMTPGNLKRFKEIQARLKTFIAENPNADTVMFFILDLQHRLVTIAQDVHFRPEVNS